MATSSIQKLTTSSWYSAVLLTLGFWLSGSLLLDFVIMPGMFVSGMMSQPGFGTAGYVLFWLFNRIELLCGAVVLTGLLILRHRRSVSGVIVSGIRSRWALSLGMGLLGIALVYTYLLTPAMGALGVPLDFFQAASEVPADMDRLHGIYWSLELLKLAGAALLLRLSYGDLSLSRSEA